MDEYTANADLSNDESFYLNLDKNNITKYAAVIKKSNGKYAIEVALKSGFIRHYPQILSLPSIINDENSFKEIKSYGFEFWNEKKVAKKIAEGDLQILPNAKDNYYLSCPHEDKNIQRHSELVSGINIFSTLSKIESGTAGAFFKMKSNDPNDDSIYLISNFHVMASLGNYDIGNEIVQPSLSNSEYLSPKKHPIATLYWMNKDDHMDAAIAKLNNNVTIREKSFSLHEAIKLKGIVNPKIGMKVRKCGSKTGTTKSTIRSVNCTVNISNDPSKKDIFRHQILTYCMSQKGDSGSVLVNRDDFVVGLIFAGNDKNATYANNIMTIFNTKIDQFKNQNLPNINFKEFV